MFYRILKNKRKHKKYNKNFHDILYSGCNNGKYNHQRFLQTIYCQRNDCMKHRFKAPQATAVMYGGNKTPFVFGKVKFYQKPTCVLVVADLEGLPETETGFYGFHIHQGNGCGGKDFAESGSHYDP